MGACCSSESLKMKNRWFKWVATCIVLVVTIVVFTVSYHFYRLYYQPMTVENSVSNIIHLDKSMSATAFAKALKSQHLIQSESLFLALVRSEHLAHRLKAGIYQVKSGETCRAFLNRVANGDVIIESFKIIEGTTQRDVSANLAKASYLNYNDADWLAIAPQFTDREGALLADTYHYNAGSQAQDVLRRAHTSLLNYLEISWKNRTPNLPYKTSYELLIAASILEKEAALPTEKRLIAGVIVNRLNKHMRLQMDPTVIYALGDNYHGKLTHEHMQVDSPYNSYRYRGLPPTPIAMVGKDAIDAAAHPELTDYLYFVARGDGSHEFSITYEQQKDAIARHLKKKGS